MSEVETGRPQPALSALTRREREILERVLQGATSRRIAESLGISLRTVEVHRANIMDKMQVANAVQLTMAAMQMKQREAAGG